MQRKGKNALLVLPTQLNQLYWSELIYKCLKKVSKTKQIISIHLDAENDYCQ